MEETPELLRSGIGVGRAASWSVWRELRAKEAGPTRRLGETGRTRLELDDSSGVSMIVYRLYRIHRTTQGVGLDLVVPH